MSFFFFKIDFPSLFSFFFRSTLESVSGIAFNIFIYLFLFFSLFCIKKKSIHVLVCLCSFNALLFSFFSFSSFLLLLHIYIVLCVLWYLLYVISFLVWLFCSICNTSLNTPKMMMLMLLLLLLIMMMVNHMQKHVSRTHFFCIFIFIFNGYVCFCIDVKMKISASRAIPLNNWLVVLYQVQKTTAFRWCLQACTKVIKRIQMRARTHKLKNQQQQQQQYPHWMNTAQNSLLMCRCVLCFFYLILQRFFNKQFQRGERFKAESFL